MGYLKSLVPKIKEVFKEIDFATKAYAKSSGLFCPPGCGQCCANPHIEVTVLEMLPLAQKIVEQGNVEDWVRRLEEARAGDESLCVSLRRTARGELEGGCRSYLERPALCRLFGYAGNRDKRGTPRLAACAVHLETQGDVVQSGESEDIVKMMPLFSDFQTELMNLEPSLSRVQLPINEALFRAIVLIGYEVDFSQADDFLTQVQV